MVEFKALLAGLVLHKTFLKDTEERGRRSFFTSGFIIHFLKQTEIKYDKLI